MYSTKKHNKMLRASIEHWSFRRYKFKNIFFWHQTSTLFFQSMDFFTIQKL